MVYGTVQEIREVPHFEKISEELQKEEALKEVARQMEEMGLSAVKIDQIVNSEIMKNFYKLLEGNTQMNRALDLMLDNEELEELIYQLEDMRNSEENLYAQYLAEDLADYIREQMELQSAQSQAVQILASMLAQGGR
jgi:heme oxygenase